MADLMRMEFKVDGIAELQKKLDNAALAVRIKAEQGMNEFTGIVFARSQELVPVQTGLLRATAIWERAKWVGKSLISLIRYTRLYAFLQHERPFKHVHGQWKYLQTSVEENSNKMAEVVGARIDEVV